MLVICSATLLMFISFANGANFQMSCAPGEGISFAEVLCVYPNICDNTDPAKNRVILLDYDLDCDNVVQIKPYSKERAIIIVKTKSKLVSIGYEGSTEPIFGCKERSGKFEPIGSQLDEKTEFTSFQQKGFTFCIMNYYHTPLFDETKKIEMKYGKEKILGKANSFASINSFVMCDPDWLNNEFTDVTDLYSFFHPDKRFKEVSCTKGELVFGDSDKNNAAVVAKSAICVKGSTDFEYVVTSKEHADVTASAKADNPLSVGCRVKVCALCETVPKCQKDGCKQPKIEKEGDCNVLKCDGNRIQVNDEPATIGNATCGKHGETFKWMVGKIPVEKISCAGEVKCQTVNKLECPECPESINVNNDEITCDGFVSVTVNAAEPYTTKSIKCNKQTGVWTAEPKKIPVAAGSKISCQSSAIGDDGEAQTGNANAGATMYAVYGVVAILIVGISTFLIWYCCVRKKKVAKAAKVKNLDESHKTSMTAPASNHSLQDNLHTATETQSNTAPASEPIKTAILKQPETIEKTAITPSVDEKNVNTALLNTTEEKLTSYDPMMGPRSFILQERKRMKKEGKKTDIIPFRPPDEINEKEQEKDRSLSLPSSVASRKTEPTRNIEPEKQPKKEGNIRRRGLSKDYPILADVVSDWEDEPDGTKKQKSKTMGTAVTAERVDQTQTTLAKPEEESEKKKNEDNKSVTVKNAETVKLVTQLDETKDEKIRNESI